MSLEHRLYVAVFLTVVGLRVAHADEEILTLRDGYRLALRNSELVWLAERDVETAEINLGATWVQIRPTINGAAEATLQRPIIIGGQILSLGRSVQVGVRAVQPLFRKGFSATREAERYAVQGATSMAGRERERLARDVAVQFVDVLRTRALVGLANGAVARAIAQYEFAVARVKAGNALKTAELLAQIDVKRAERQLASAKLDAALAEVAFKRLVGQPPPPVLDLPVPDVPPSPKPAGVGVERLDMRALELRVHETAERVKAARDQRWWPRVDVEGSIRYYEPEALQRNVDWRLLGTVSIPLLQSGREAADVALRENELHMAKLQRDRQRRLLTEEIDGSAVLLATAGEVADLADKQLQTAREHYKLVDKQFRLGAITFLEVTNAMAALAEAENAFEIARMDRVRAVYEYLFVTGRLDLDASSKSPTPPSVSK
jgi:outer membrane protein TolC